MNMLVTRLPRPALAIAALLLGANLAAAQVDISGSLSDTTTGPLLTGVVYHAVGNLDVPAGQTLTAQPGAVVKFSGGANYFTVHGTLDVQGTNARKVIFTDVRDDTAGGDSNHDGGATLPAKASWAGLYFYATAGASSIVNAEVRYGGYSYYGGIHAVQADIRVSHVAVRHCFAAGLDLEGETTGISVDHCDFTDNQVAINRVPLQAVPGFDSNTASGNGLDILRVTVGTFVGDLTIAPQSCLEGALVFSQSPTIAVGQTLTIQAGVVIKFDNPVFVITHGTLDVQGSPTNPVIFTAYADDSVAGDTNGDGGASLPAKASWAGLFFDAAADASSVVNAEVRYGGYNYYGGIHAVQADIHLSYVAVRHCYAAGLDLEGETTGISVDHCDFTDNQVAINRVPLQAVPGFDSNTASGNGLDILRVTVGTFAGNVTIGPQACLEGALVFTQSPTVAVGQTLTIQAGVVIKFDNPVFVIARGTLDVQGSPTNPVIFTAYADDSVGGDTNGDGGASLPAKASWAGLYFDTTADASSVVNAEVRYGGYNFYGGIHALQADIHLSNVAVRHCYAAGLDLEGETTGISVDHCDFTDNQIAINRVPLQAVPGFDSNTASGNGLDILRVTSSVFSGDLTILPHSCLEGAIVLATTFTIPAGQRLTATSGVIFKFETGYVYAVVSGALDIQGTPTLPVVFTSWEDDAYGGDNNGDGGATLPHKSSWSGLIYQSTSEVSLVQNVLVRYSGYNYYSGIQSSGANLTLDGARVEHTFRDGIELAGHVGEAHRLVAWDCNGSGVTLLGGTFDVRQATSVGNARGFVLSGGTCRVLDSIAWGNSSANYQGFGAGTLRYSDGSPTLAGTNGNIDTDPRFASAAAGDFHLLDDSPCVDTGDPLSLADPDGTRADMGAYPVDQCGPVLYCTGKTNSVGCVPFLEFTGHASVSDPAPFTVTARNVINNKNGILFYGTNGALAAPFQGGTLCVAGPFERLPVQNSHGNPPPNDCSGVLVVDFNAVIQSGHDPALVMGATVHSQGWYRDPNAPFATGLTNGIRFRVCP